MFFLSFSLFISKFVFHTTLNDFLPIFPPAVLSKHAIPTSWCFILRLRITRIWTCKYNTVLFNPNLIWFQNCGKLESFISRWLNKLGLAAIHYGHTDDSAVAGKLNAAGLFLFFYGRSVLRVLNWFNWTKLIKRCTKCWDPLDLTWTCKI